MSKIIEALEKARRDGPVSDAVAAVDERATVTGLVEGSPRHASPRPSRSTQSRGRSRSLMAVKELDPEALRGVDPHVETLHRPMSLVAEQYRELRSKIERLNLTGRIRTLAVTSSEKGAGKSVTAANLAIAMAQDGNRSVLLVDADLRCPMVHQLLGIAPEPGLADRLQGTAELSAVVQATPFFGLSVVTAGNVLGHPSELLASPEFDEFLADCRREYDYVIVDATPLFPLSDLHFLAETVDGVLLVVCAGKTSKELLQEAAKKLPHDKVIGAVLNRVDEAGPGYRYKGYGYGYGYEPYDGAK